MAETIRVTVEVPELSNSALSLLEWIGAAQPATEVEASDPGLNPLLVFGLIRRCGIGYTTTFLGRAVLEHYEAQR